MNYLNFSSNCICISYSKLKLHGFKSWFFMRARDIQLISKTDFRDTLQDFDDFRNKQQKCMKQCFFICRSMYILKVYSIHYALW